MEKFSYNVEFYKNHIFTIEELMNRRDEQDNANYVEKNLSEFNNNIDIIRDYILISYRLNKYLTKEERLQYVRGVIYSSQLLNEEDFNTFVDIICSDNKESLERSIFSTKNSSNSYDKEYFSDYVKMLNCNFENLGVDEELKPDDDDTSLDTIEEDEEDGYEDITEEYKSRITTLSAIEKIDFLDANFDNYIKGVLKYKKISKRNNKFEYELIYRGAEEYFIYIRDMIYNAYEFILEEKKRKESLKIFC